MSLHRSAEIRGLELRRKGLRENLWVSDYNTGQYTEPGLAAYLFINNENEPVNLLCFGCRTPDGLNRPRPIDRYPKGIDYS